MAAIKELSKWLELVAILAASFTCVIARAQTVDQVIAKNIQAHQGSRSLNPSTRHARPPEQGPFRAEVAGEKRPGKGEEFSIQGMAQVQAYDGKAAGRLTHLAGARTRTLSQDDLKSLVVDADIDGPLVDYKEKGHKAELVGHDSVEGTDCYKIKLSMKNGDARYYYLDTDSFLELKLEIQTTIRGALQESEVYYGDYEKVNGVYYPFSVEQAPKGSSSRAQISVEKVEQNVPMDDAHFSVPVSKPEAKASPAGS